MPPGNASRELIGLDPPTLVKTADLSEVVLGFGRIVALYLPSPTSYQIYKEIRYR